MLPSEEVRRLRDALAAAAYTYDAVAARLGPLAHHALARNETTPGLRATGSGDALDTLVRLWPLQATVDTAAVERALPGLTPALEAAGLLERSGEAVRARADVRPYADDEQDWWVVSDLTPGLDGAPIAVRPDHVLGVSPASSSLAQLTVRAPVGAALDLGTGCGVQALHLARHAGTVVATDVNPRALRMAGLTAGLNELALDVREGSLFEPVGDQRFDLVVSNPPFVISPASGDRLVYRDSGLPGDEMVRRLVDAAPDHLAPGGRAQVLANWVHERGRPWPERVSSWLAGSGCDAWVVQREIADVAEYVELWLKDAGLHGTSGYATAYDEWLTWFEQHHVEAVGFGWLVLRRVDRDPVVRLEEWPFEVEQPLAPEVAEQARRVDWLSATTDQALLGARLVARVDVRQETHGEPGAADPESILLRQQRGLRRARRVDTVEAGLVGASDGELTVGQVLDALAQLLGEDPTALRNDRLAAVRDLVAEGFLVP